MSARPISSWSSGSASAWPGWRAQQFKCPVNQYVIADALGLSAIHVNRVLRQLREQGLLTVGAGEVTIADLVKLRALAGHRSVDADREDE